MQVRAGGGFYCSRCGNVEGAPERVRENRAAACVTDQSSRQVQKVEAPVAPAPEPELVEVGAGIKSDPVPPRGTVNKPRPTFGRGSKTP